MFASVHPIDMTPAEAQAQIEVLAYQCPAAIKDLKQDYIDELLRAALADYPQYLRSRAEVASIRAARRKAHTEGGISLLTR